MIDESLLGLYFTADPLAHSLDKFAERADALGYLGRHGYDLGGLYYDAVQGEYDADA